MTVRDVIAWFLLGASLASLIYVVWINIHARAEIRDAVAKLHQIRRELEEFRELTEKRETAVHVLSEGLPLCGFSDRVPGEWPPGHRWVRIGEPGVSCEGCKERLESGGNQ